MAGVESLGRELQGAAPHVFVPAGSGGLFVAVSRGLSGSARVHAVQPEGCSTFEAAYQRGDDEILPVISRTRVSGLSVPFDIDATLALQELRAKGGLAISISDEAIFEAQAMMMELEGIYAEPAGAAALAGVRQALRVGTIAKTESAVCVVSGHGFKDPFAAESIAARHPAVTVDVAELGDALA